MTGDSIEAVAENTQVDQECEVLDVGGGQALENFVFNSIVQISEESDAELAVVIEGVAEPSTADSVSYST